MRTKETLTFTLDENYIEPGNLAEAGQRARNSNGCGF